MHSKNKMFLNDKKQFYFLKNEVAHIVGPVKKNKSLNITQHVFGIVKK